MTQHAIPLLILSIVLLCTPFISSAPIATGCISGLVEDQLRINQVYRDFVCTNTTHSYQWFASPIEYTIEIKLCSKTTCDDPQIPPSVNLRFQFFYSNTSLLQNIALPSLSSNLTSLTYKFKVNATETSRPYFLLRFIDSNITDATYYGLNVRAVDPCYDDYEPNEDWDMRLLNVTTPPGLTPLKLCTFDVDNYYLASGRGNLLVSYDLDDTKSVFYIAILNKTTLMINGIATITSSSSPYILTTSPELSYWFVAKSSTSNITYHLDWQYTECLDSPVVLTLVPGSNGIQRVCNGFGDVLQFTSPSPVPHKYYFHIDGEPRYKFTAVVTRPDGTIATDSVIDTFAFPTGIFNIRVTVTGFVTDPLGAKYIPEISDSPCLREDVYGYSNSTSPIPIVLDTKERYVIGTTCLKQPDVFKVSSGFGNRQVTMVFSLKEQIETGSKLNVAVDGMLPFNLESNATVSYSVNLMENETKLVTLTFDRSSSAYYNFTMISKVLMCPMTTPVRCPSGKCVSTYKKCTTDMVACPNDAPFRCYNGTCAKTPSLCWMGVTCPAGRCWNGKCIADETECPMVPSCPLMKSLRCWNGCFTANHTCENTTLCNNSFCEDGSCRVEGETCPSFNGCPVGSLQCPNGKCVVSMEDCLCPGNLWRCADKTCVDKLSDCKKANFQMEIMEVQQTFVPTVDTEIVIPAVDMENACYVRVPSGAVKDSETEVMLMTKAVSDTAMQAPKLLRSSGDMTDILSPVFNVEIMGSDGEVTRHFEKEITISCVVSVPENYSTDALCLAFINTTSNQWECADLSLTIWNVTHNSSSNILYVNGTTSHFTSFGVLLGDDPTDDGVADTNVPNENDNHKSESVSTGVIIAVVVCAGVVILVGLVASIVFFRKRKEKEDGDLNEGIELNADGDASTSTY